jgi:hypothetical protein
MNASSLAMEYHTDAVLYPITQVFGGKTLLADFTSTYGLYAELLNPLFHLIGLSVFKFTCVMTVLLLLGVIALFKAFTMIVKRVSFWFLFCCSLALIMSAWVLLDPQDTPYFQYFPIRFLFPALGTFLFIVILKSEKYSKRHENKWIALMGVLSAFGIFWNLDSGIPLIGSIFCWLLMRLILINQKLVHYADLKKMTLVIITFLLSVSCLFIYLTLKAKAPLSLGNLFKYQEIYYMTGYNQIPLPRTVHPWMAILGIYGFGIVYSLYIQLFRTNKGPHEIVFFLSVMGIGLFTYYQGRANEYNLLSVIWPAIFIVLVLADRNIKNVKDRLIPRHALLPVAAAILLTSIFSTAFLIKIPDLINISTARYRELTFRGNTMAEENMRFIATHIGNSRSAVIISQKQSAYLAELGLVSPINGPGISETILKSDIDSFFRQISEKNISKIFICLESDGSVHQRYVEYIPLSKKYKIAASVDIDHQKLPPWDGYMNLLVPYQQPVENILLK